MDIYVVKPNDTIYTIARQYNVSATQLIRNNDLEFPNRLVPGQTIVIVYPTQTYVVKSDDTLESIANEFGISQMLLLRNNPFLSDTPLIAGENLTIRYNTTGEIVTSGYIYPYIDKDILKKTLPSLTYLTVYNYRAISEGYIISYTDDIDVVKIAKEYGTIPLMMATTLSAQGEPDIETAYNILLNDDYQDTFVDQILTIIKEKGYLGANLVFNYMNPSSLTLYINIVAKLKNVLDKEGYLLFVTINPNTKYVNKELTFEKIDYSGFRDLVHGITFLQFIWGTNYGPPLPVNSIYKIQTFLDYAVTVSQPDKISVGVSLISYDWQLPYIPGSSYANSLSLRSALRLAQNVDVTIQFDERSKSPFFTYVSGEATNHIVWTVDARSISALVDLITEYGLNGAGFWNLMNYTAQLWLVINSQFEVLKLIPNNFDK